MSDSDEESYHYSDEDMEDHYGDGDDDNGGGGEDDEEESEFSFSSDDQGSADDVEVAVENAYYNAKGLRETSLEEAASAFEEVVEMERKALLSSNGGDGGGGESKDAYGPWSYKAIKQLVKLHVLRTGDRDAMMSQYRRLLNCIVAGAVSQNAIEKGVNGILERVSQSVAASGGGGTTLLGGAVTAIDRRSLKEMYDATLAVFRPRDGPCPNERLWFKTNLKLGQLLYEMNETAQLQQVIRDLLRGQRGDDSSAGAESSSAAGEMSQRFGGTHLLEIYALQIQLYSRQKDTKKLRELFERAMRVEGGIPHPRTIALIQELGGKMHMASREFEAAGKTFFQAFKSYDEAGDPSRLRCLKYLVMASMLHASTINPFDSQEARPYKDDPEIVAMTNLVQAFHANEIRKFEGILRRNEGKIMDDEFVREHVADLLRTIRTQVLQNVIAPYTKITLDFIARELNGIPTEEVESLLVSLILDGKLQGRIDQVKGVLLKGDPAPMGTAAAANSGTGGSDSSVPSNFNASASSALEARNAMAIDQLAKALGHLTTGITSAGGRSSHHQIM